MYDFQFFDQERIRELFQIEFEHSEAKRAKQDKIKELRTNAVRMRRRASRGDVEAAEKVEEFDAEADALESTLAQHVFPSKLLKERENLIEQAFSHWTKNMFRKVISACELYVVFFENLFFFFSSFTCFTCLLTGTVETRRMRSCVTSLLKSNFLRKKSQDT